MCLRYKVVLNGQSHVHATWDTRQRIENILAGEYHVSVLAENDEGQSEAWPQQEEEEGGEKVEVEDALDDSVEIISDTENAEEEDEVWDNMVVINSNAKRKHKSDKPAKRTKLK